MTSSIDRMDEYTDDYGDLHMYCFVSDYQGSRRYLFRVGRDSTFLKFIQEKHLRIGDNRELVYTLKGFTVPECMDMLDKKEYSKIQELRDLREWLGKHCVPGVELLLQFVIGYVPHKETDAIIDVMSRYPFPYTSYGHYTLKPNIEPDFRWKRY